MDIYCRICGEPWDMDTIHEVIDERIRRGDFGKLPHYDSVRSNDPTYVEYRRVYDGYYQTVRSEFYSKGCAALTGYTSTNCTPKASRDDGKLTKAQAMDVLIDILGDDLDGIASMMDDGAYMGVIE